MFRSSFSSFHKSSLCVWFKIKNVTRNNCGEIGLSSRCIMSSAKSKDEVTSAPLKQVWKKPTAKAYLQIFGTGSGDTSPSIYLFADSQRYIFSCGEATQRLFHESKLKLGKINNLFITQVCWDLVGGLPGFLLTLRDIGKKTLSIHGPTTLTNFLKSMQSFLFMQNLDLNCVQYSEGESEKFEDENIIVWPICVQGKENDNFSYNSEIVEIKERSDCYQSDSKESGMESGNDQNLNSQGSSYETKSRKRCKFSINPKPVVSYICQLVPMPGKVNLEKAKALGVPKGPLLGQLQKGKSVILKNGTVVKPKDVVETSTADSIFCIIDCPSMDYFEKLVKNKQLVMHEESGSKPQPLVIIHLSPADVVETDEYSNWTRRFGSTCQHLFLNSKMSPPKIAMLSQLRIQYKLHQLNPDMFPKLFASDLPNIEINNCDHQNWKAGENFLMFHLRPPQRIGYDTSDIELKWDTMAKKIQQRQPETITKEIPLTDIKKSLKNFIDPKTFSLKDYDSVLDEGVDGVFVKEFKNMDKNFEIVFLGTGACLPSKYRNVSSTLVNISENKLMLLDCGEGTYGQLYRHYGPNLDKILLKLCCIFISHMHADHHLGLIRVLQARHECVQCLPRENRPDHVLVVGPPSLLLWLRNYGIFYETLHLSFLDSFKFQINHFIGHEVLSSVLEANKVSIISVEHSCHHAYGLVLSHKNGWKLVYSGDTRPCEDLLKYGQGATVLIHEATFEDDLLSEAVKKMHSTTTEAIQCGQKMNAKFVLLTHFSQRYPKIPVFSEKFNDCTGIAFDHMMVNFQNIFTVPRLLEPLQEIFKEEIQE